MRRPFFAPEVVQASKMDCGPASLKCLLDGHGIRVSYGRLREACQTDVDGTSIDVLEDVAIELGLPAEQVVIPADNIFEDAAHALPALAVVWLPGGGTHFVVIWRTFGPFVQVMDPSVGRMWMTREALRRSLYQHEMPVSAEDWFEWAQSAEFTGPIASRLVASGLSHNDADDAVAKSIDQGATSLARLDAASRWLHALARAGGAKSPGALLQRLMNKDIGVPRAYWSAIPASDPDEVILRGAVLLRIGDEPVDASVSPESLPESLAAALNVAEPHPVRQLVALMREDGVFRPALLAGIAFLAGLGAAVEALIFMGLLEVWQYLAVPEQRLAALGAGAAFFGLLLVWQFGLGSGQRWLGRRLELRIRQRLREKLPRFEDRYFGSRLVSDMAERAHALRSLRQVPAAAVGLVATLATLLATTAGLVWLAPHVAWLPILATLIAVAVPLALQPLSNERDLRARTHVGALSRFYLDALRGIQPVRTHGAEEALSREHESLLAEWMRANLSLVRIGVGVSAITSLLGVAIAAALVFAYIQDGGATAGLLVVYWALAIPALADQFAGHVRQYPAFRNVLLRTMELMDAPERRVGDPAALRAKGGVAITFDGVGVVAGGQTIVQDVSFDIAPGEHVAVVGRSGSGKSTIIGALLGFQGTAAGAIAIDGKSLDEVGTDALRACTTWVDPAVHLWNSSLVDNLRYGSALGAEERASRVVELAGLRPVLEELPDGLQTILGEGGSLVSGGEGQRVRLGRSLMGEPPRLALIDEAFRGLDRETRRRLRGAFRQEFDDATLLCVTHDIDETTDFDKIIVVDDGTVVEVGSPEELSRPDSAYHALVEADRAARESVWNAAGWRRIEMKDGRLHEDDHTVEAPQIPQSPADSQDDLSTAPTAWCWPLADAHRALSALVSETSGKTTAPLEPVTRGSSAALIRWFETITASLDTDAQHIAPRYDEVDDLLRHGGPCVILVDDGENRGLLTVLRGGRRTIDILGPNGPMSLPREEIARAIRARTEASLRPSYEEVVGEAGIASGRQEELVSTMLADELASLPCAHAWLLRAPAHAPARVLFSEAGTFGWLGRLVGVHVVQHALFIAAWWLIGGGLLAGTLDTGLLMGWAMAMATTIPLAAMARWYQGMASMSASAVMRRRLLNGALRIPASRLRSEGAGHLMARVFESEALESLAMSGGLIGAVAIIELASAAIVLGFAGGLWPTFALLLFSALAAALVAVAYRRQRSWTIARRNLTHDLVERMVGHRTRLVQARASTIHDGEDELLNDFARESRDYDRTAVLIGLIGRAWLVVGGLSLIPVLLGGGSLGAFAASIGGVLLARNALGALASSAMQLGGAYIAWEQAEPLFNAGAEAPETGVAGAREAAARRTSQPGDLLIDAHDIRRTYPGKPRPAVESSLEIRTGDHLLLTGPSGGGKSTFARLITGLESPDGGLLLLDGLDRHTLGLRGWRDRVVGVPQFHENHILSGPIAFNLLMGAEWPAPPELLERAREVCEGLGLGELIDRMPGDMMQMVGDTGWQLSHGERNRLFIARALLQDAELIVFDEAFAALDPHTLVDVMNYVRENTRTMMVIAHP